MGHVFADRNEPTVDRLVRKRIEKLLQQRFVGDPNRPQRKLHVGLGRSIRFQLFGVLPPLAGDIRLILIDQIQLLGAAEQIGAELRVRDPDQLHRSFSRVLPVQIGDAVLRHHVMNIPTGERDAGPFAEKRRNPRHLSVARGGRQHEDRLPVGREQGATHEVGLPADPAVELLPERLGGRLSGEIDLQRRVDRRHLRMHRDHRRVVGVVDGAERHRRVVTQELVRRLAAHAE